MKLYIRLEAPFEWVRVSGNSVEAFGEVPSLADYPLADEDDIIGVVPGEFVTVHRLSLPAKTKRQFQTAVPFALEEAVSEDIEDLHFTCPHWKAGEECVVYVVAKEQMRHWQQIATQHKLAVERMIPDYALLPFHEAAECSLGLMSESTGESSAQQQHILASRKQGGGACVDVDFLDAWLMEVPMAETIAVNDADLTEQLISDHPDRDFRHWDFGGKLAHWLEHAPSKSYDLMTEEYRPAVSNFNWRTFAVPAALFAAAVFCIFAFDTYRYLALHAEIRALNKAQADVVLETFSDVEGVEAMEGNRKTFVQLLKRAAGGNTLPADSMPSMLAETSAVLRGQNVSLENIVFREDALVITCLLNDFSQVDLLTTQLNARPRISASLQSSSSDDGQIIASYAIAAS